MECPVPPETTAVHGLTDEFLKDKPVFKEVMSEFIEFFSGAVAIAHNSEFDEKFLNSELQRAEHKESFWSIVADTKCTLRISRRIWGKNENGVKYQHTLDAIMDRCGVDRSARVNHGALIDSELLAETYQHLKVKLEELGPSLEDDFERAPIERLDLTGVNLPRVQPFKPETVLQKSYKP